MQSRNKTERTRFDVSRSFSERISPLAAYLIVNLKFHNLDWTKDYLANVPALVRAHGGEYLARSKRVEKYEGPGTTPDNLTILTFPSLDAIRSFLESPEYAPYREARVHATESELLAFET
jgi:uncharacterized protein (DUF1330 family)